MVVVESFLRYLITEKRYSPHTVRSYQNDLLQFEQFCNSIHVEGPITGCTTRHVRSWVIALLDSGLSPRSVNRKITTLRRFYRFCQMNGQVRVNPALAVPSLKTGKPLPAFVEEGQMDALLEPVAESSGFTGIRNLLVLELLYGTGIRVSELVGLRNADIDLGRGQIKVLGKRSKERLVPINPGLCQRIRDYREAIHEELGEVEAERLILTDRGGPAYSRMIYAIVNQAMQEAGITGRKSPHVLRHTYATHLLNRGAELNAIKELLGHASLSATQVYTHTGFEKLKKVYEKAHPRA